MECACIEGREGEILEAVQNLLVLRLTQALNGRVIESSGTDGWWTGSFSNHTYTETYIDDEGNEQTREVSHWCWGGVRHTGRGLLSEVHVDGRVIKIDSYWAFGDLGPFHKEESEDTREE